MDNFQADQNHKFGYKIAICVTNFKRVEVYESCVAVRGTLMNKGYSKFDKLVDWQHSSNVFMVPNFL